MKRLAGADVIPKFFDQVLQRAAVAEPSPFPAPHRFVREYAFAVVVVDDPNNLVDVLDALALQSEFGLCGHGCSMRDIGAMILTSRVVLGNQLLSWRSVH